MQCGTMRVCHRAAALRNDQTFPLIHLRVCLWYVDCGRINYGPVIIRWFLIQIAHNVGDVANTDKVVRTIGGHPS